MEKKQRVTDGVVASEIWSFLPYTSGGGNTIWCALERIGMWWVSFLRSIVGATYEVRKGFIGCCARGGDKLVTLDLVWEFLRRV